MEGHHFLVKPLLRPVVVTRLIGARTGSNNLAALVDSGADHVVAAPWVAQDIGVIPDPDREIRLKIGGSVRRVRFADVTVQLFPPEIGLFEGGYQPTLAHEWQAQVGFFTEWDSPPWSIVFGQVGFFDQLTVSFSRVSQALAITHLSDFDERFLLPPPSLLCLLLGSGHRRLFPHTYRERSLTETSAQGGQHHFRDAAGLPNDEAAHLRGHRSRQCTTMPSSL